MVKIGGFTYKCFLPYKHDSHGLLIEMLCNCVLWNHFLAIAKSLEWVLNALPFKEKGDGFPLTKIEPSPFGLVANSSPLFNCEVNRICSHTIGHFEFLGS